MRQDDGREAARAQEDEACVCAEEGRVAELKGGAGEGGSGADAWMGQPELVVVMDVSDGEVERWEEEEETEWDGWWWRWY